MSVSVRFPPGVESVLGPSSVRWKAVGAGVVILLPPHLYKCGGTEGRNWAAKYVIEITVGLLRVLFLC